MITCDLDVVQQKSIPAHNVKIGMVIAAVTWKPHNEVSALSVLNGKHGRYDGTTL